MTILSIIGAFALGYFVGKRIGIAQTMLRMESIIADLQKIELNWNRKQWNEDNL
jgi:hypothetical protein